MLIRVVVREEEGRSTYCCCCRALRSARVVVREEEGRCGHLLLVLQSVEVSQSGRMRGGREMWLSVVVVAAEC